MKKPVLGEKEIINRMI